MTSGIALQEAQSPMRKCKACSAAWSCQLICRSQSTTCFRLACKDLSIQSRKSEHPNPWKKMKETTTMAFHRSTCMRSLHEAKSMHRKRRATLKDKSRACAISRSHQMSILRLAMRARDKMSSVESTMLS